MVQVLCCFTSTETIRTVRNGDPRMATSTFTRLLNSGRTTIRVQCCRTSTETIIIRTFRDGEPRVATSTFTLLLSPADPWVRIQCCFMSTAVVRIVRDGTVKVSK